MRREFPRLFLHLKVDADFVQSGSGQIEQGNAGTARDFFQRGAHLFP